MSYSRIRGYLFSRFCILYFQNFSLLDVQLQCADGSRSLRHIITHFVERTYSELGRRTYCIPQKPPVNQQHPDKALVRTREGEFRSDAFSLLCVVPIQSNATQKGDTHKRHTQTQTHIHLCMHKHIHTHTHIFYLSVSFSLSLFLTHMHPLTCLRSNLCKHTQLFLSVCLSLSLSLSHSLSLSLSLSDITAMVDWA